MSDKGGGVRGYKYYFGLHMGISRGPVNALVTIKVGDKVVWPRGYTEHLFQDGEGYLEDGHVIHGQTPYDVVHDEDPPQKVSGRVNIFAPDIFGGDDGEGGIEGPLDVMMGEDSQEINGDLAAMLGGLVSAFRGMFTLFFDGLVCSNNPYPKAWKFRVRRSSKGWQNDDCWYAEKAVVFLNAVFPDVAGGIAKDHGIHAMNPAHIIYECLTNSQWGRGIPAELIDTDSFTYAADTLCCEGFGLCLKWMREDDIMNFIQVVVDHIGAFLYPSRETGLLVLKLVRQDYVVADLPIFDTSTGLLSISDDDEAAAEPLTNEVVVTYVDPITGDDKQVRVHNVAGLQASGAVNSKPVDYKGAPTHELAARLAQRDLKALGSPLRRLKLTFDRRAWKIAPGTVFRIASPERGIANLVLRAGRVEDGVEDGSSISVLAIQDIFSLPATAFVGYVEPTPGQNTDPVPADPEVLKEASFVDTIRNSTSAEYSTLVDDDTFVMLLASRPKTLAINFRVMTGLDPNALTDRGLGNFAPSGKTTAILEGDQLLFLSDIKDRSRIKNEGAVLINDEVMSIVQWKPEMNALVVGRGCMDTIPQKHAEGSICWFYYLGNGRDKTIYTEGEEVHGKVLTHTSSGYLDINDAVDLSVTTVNRRQRPYPPAALLINSKKFYETSGAKIPMTVNWALRNRLTQADLLLAHGGSNVAPELLQTTTVEILDAAGVVTLRTVSGLTGNSWVYDATMWAADGSPTSITLRVFSDRDGIESWKTYMIPLTIIPDSGWGTGWGYKWGGTVAGLSMSHHTVQAPAAIRAGNRQVVFFRFGGAPNDAAFAPVANSQFFVNVKQRGFALGDADIYNFTARVTVNFPSSGSVIPLNTDLCNLVSDVGNPGDHGITYLAGLAGVDVHAYDGASHPPPNGSDWCEDFMGPTSSLYPYGIVFPVGERVSVKTDPSGADVAGYGEHQVTMYVIPGFPAPTSVNRGVGLGTGFLDRVTVDRPQIEQVLVDALIIPGYTYRITLDAMVFDYVALSGDTQTVVAGALRTLINTTMGSIYLASATGNDITITGESATPFTVATAVLP